MRKFILILLLSAIIIFLFFESGIEKGQDNVRSLITKNEVSQIDEDEYVQLNKAVANLNELNKKERSVAVFVRPLPELLIAQSLYPHWYSREFQTLVQDTNNIRVIADKLVNAGVNYMLLDKHWNVNAKQKIIEQMSQEISVFEPFTIRMLHHEYRFQTELLKNPNFLNTDAWNFSKNTKLSTNGVIVKLKTPATQVVSVTAGQRYLISIKSSCLNNPAQGRVQVNWMTAKKFINTNIKVFDCQPLPSIHSMEVIAPEDALIAVIYATGHSEEYLVMHEISFRQ